jgi:hypothetical protein
MNVSPLTIRIMFAIHCVPDGTEQFVPSSEWNSPAGRGARQWLLENNLIILNDGESVFRATERGAAWIKYICDTPLPISQWVLPNRELAV